MCDFFCWNDDVRCQKKMHPIVLSFNNLLLSSLKCNYSFTIDVHFSWNNKNTCKECFSVFLVQMTVRVGLRHNAYVRFEWTILTTYCAGLVGMMYFKYTSFCYFQDCWGNVFGQWYHNDIREEWVSKLNILDFILDFDHCVHGLILYIISNIYEIDRSTLSFT